MRSISTFGIWLGFVIFAIAAPAFAQEPPSTPPANPLPAAAAGPGVITGGSGNTSIGGLPAARRGDATDKGAPLVEGSPDVFINGKPAVTVGGRTGCGGITVGGSSNVFINGKPVARSGDMTTECPGK